MMWFLLPRSPRPGVSGGNGCVLLRAITLLPPGAVASDGQTPAAVASLKRDDGSPVMDVKRLRGDPAQVMSDPVDLTAGCYLLTVSMPERAEPPNPFLQRQGQPHAVGRLYNAGN